MKIAAGKFRRYTHIKAWEYLRPKYWEILGRNIVDFCKVVWAILASFCRMIIWRPNVVFLKGGYVSLPVGLAAIVLRVPFVIHDSDAALGLTSRMLVRHAKKVALGMPVPKKYQGDDKYEWVGIPVSDEFHKTSARERNELAAELGFDSDKPLVVATGGSQGSLHLNDAIGEILPELLKFAYVVLVAGKNKYQESVQLKDYEVWEEGNLQSNFRLLEFVPDMSKLIGAASIVISRAGATTIAEMAAMRKATILIPYGVLPGAHQSKNAQMLVDAGAAEAIEDEELVENPRKLLAIVKALVRNDKRREDMAKKLYEMSKTDATQTLAAIILKVAG